MPASRLAARAEPRWRPRRLLIATPIPPRARRWLFDASSLTKRVIAACPGTFRLEVIRLAWCRPLRGEAMALDLHPYRRALVREVHLCCAETPWVYARTIIPRTTPAGPTRRLVHLRARSLGAVLFADPSTERGEVQVAPLTPAEAIYRDAVRSLPSPPAQLWARRTRFLLLGRPLLVTEVFLPALPDFP